MMEMSSHERFSLTTVIGITQIGHKSPCNSQIGGGGAESKAEGNVAIASGQQFLVVETTV